MFRRIKFRELGARRFKESVRRRWRSVDKTLLFRRSRRQIRSLSGIGLRRWRTVIIVGDLTWWRTLSPPVKRVMAGGQFVRLLL